MSSSSDSDTNIKAAWQGQSAERWLKEQQRIDELLRPFGQAALMTLAAASGEWILDIGCGAGTTSLELAEAVGPSGGVCCVDISEPLLERARERCLAAGLTNMKFVLADAASHRFDRGFDALFSRFGVMFFADPVAAFSNLHAALHPSGRLSFVCWQELERNPWMAKPLHAARAVAPELPLPEMFLPGQPGPVAFGDQDYVNDSLRAAGFRQVDITAFERPVNLGATVEEATDYCMFVGPAARLIADAGQPVQQLVREAIIQTLEPYVTSRGLLLDAATFVVSARA